MTQVPLYDKTGAIVAYAMVDDEDAAVVLALRWHRDSSGYPARFHQRMHELVADRMGIRGLQRNVDHRDGDPMNNRRKNLRPASQGVNVRNPANRLRMTNQSGVRGVWWSADREKWCVQGTRDGRKVHLGRFTDLAEAVAVRRVWERQET